jgi:formate dehydrogenase iron-sulfur subunit
MATRIFVSGDSSALSVGADQVVQMIENEAKRRGAQVSIVRNGSRGMMWLEPLVEVETPAGRIGYGGVEPAMVTELFQAGFLDGSKHASSIGKVDDHPFLVRQERLCFSRVGITDPLSIDEYRALRGWQGLQSALRMSVSEAIHQLTESGLRGRGGAAFPAAIKWKTVSETAADTKYVVCNADEGDSGTFSDRMTLEGDPFALIEGMAIAGVVTGAQTGYIYVRSEYPHAERKMIAAIEIARQHGYLGPDVMGSGKSFDLEVRRGAGAYICGEETALLESLEGKRGMVRYKPPVPAISGLFGKPTVVNNVITFTSVPIIFDRGAEYYRDFGMGRSRGTLPIQLTGNIKHGGLVEKALGVTLRELLYDYGGGAVSGRPIRAVQVGGPLGAFLPESQFDTPLDYESFAAIGAMIGHGGIVVFDDTVDMAKMARYAMEFCAIESCGKCTPCRIGSTRGLETMDRIIAGSDVPAQVTVLEDLCNTMLHGSLCALGGMTPFPVLSALKHFPQDFGVERDAIRVAS